MFIKGGQTRCFNRLVAIILAMVAVRALSHYFRSINFEKAGQGVVFDLRTKLYDHLQEMPYEFYDKNRIAKSCRA